MRFSTLKLFIVIVLLAFPNFLNAQISIYSEGFEASKEFPEGFIILNFDGNQIAPPVSNIFSWEDNGWIVGTILHEPNNNFAITSSRFENQEQADRWMILPKIQLTTNNYLMWRARQSSNKPENWETYQILISDTGTEKEDFTMIYESKPTYSFEYPKINLSDLSDREVYIAFRSVGENGWMLFVDDISVVQLMDSDLSLDKIELPDFLNVGEYSFAFSVTNWGNNSVDSVTIHWLENEKAISGSEKIFTNGLDSFDKNDFLVEQKIPFNNPGAYDLKFWVSYADGTSDEVPGNDTLYLHINVLSDNKVPKKVLLEYFTGTWCGYCPRGALTIKNIMNEEIDFIPIAIHGGNNDEPMRTYYGDTLINYYNPSFPTGLIDRVKFDDQNQINTNDSEWQKLIERRLNTPVPVIVSSIYKLDNSGKTIEVEVEAEFVEDVHGNYTFNAYIIEDKVTGDSRYDQTNYFNDDRNYPDLYKKGNPIPGYEHRYVLRELLGGAWGYNHPRDGIPTNIEKGSKYSHTFKTELNSDYNINELYVVAYVMKLGKDRKSDEILNADFQKIEVETGIAELSDGTLLIIYPNPASDYIEINLERWSPSSRWTPSEIKIYNTFGKCVMTETIHSMTRSHRMNISRLPVGLYFIQIGNYSEKFVVVR